MKTDKDPFTIGNRSSRAPVVWLAAGGTLLLLAFLAVLAGCSSSSPQAQNKSFFTSGSREADQRASQTMAKAEELSGSGEGSGEKGTKRAKAVVPSATGMTPGTNRVLQATGKTSLYERLGGEVGISNIVSDVMPRLLQDPRLNWDRQGVKSGTIFHHTSMTWNATPQNVATLSQHLVEFLVLATGGPAHYTGKDIKTIHAGMNISNPEFDAAIGDIKATLDRLRIPNTEQKEVLSIIESTRTEIVEER